MGGVACEVPVSSRLDRGGVLLVLLAGAGFGANAIFAKLAYSAGVTVGTFLTVRFCLAAIVFWLLLRPRFARGEVAPGLLLGLAYCGQSAFYFTAVSMQDASATSVFQAVTPAIVAVAAVVIGRERPQFRIFAAVLVAVAGTAMVALFSTSSVGTVVPLGVALAVAASIWYSGYLLVGDRVVGSTDPLRLGCLIATGGGIGFLVGTSVIGQLRFDFQPIGWVYLAASAVVATVISVTAVMAGMKRIGPSLTGILTTFEPVATIVYAFIIFNERFTPLQAVGAGLVISAVIVVQLPSRTMPA
jgi:drug/metabolite transporter (DMT)-like permease